MVTGSSGAGGFDLVKAYDKSTPRLLGLCSAGQRRPIKFALMSALGDKRLVFTFTFKGALIEHILLRAPGFGDRSGLLLPVLETRAVEELRLNFEEVKWAGAEHRL